MALAGKLAVTLAIVVLALMSTFVGALIEMAIEEKGHGAGRR